MSGLTSFSGGSGAVILVPVAPLPIELIAFEVTNNNNETAWINWSTASELDNEYFQIDRNIDGANWEHVATIEGAGTVNHSINYSIIDNTPYSGISYYRLKQVDFNGDFEFSDIKVLKFSIALTAELTVVPNPTHSLITITGEENELSGIELYNIYGKEMNPGTIDKENGLRTMDLSRLASGVYYLQSQSNSIKVLKE